MLLSKTVLIIAEKFQILQYSQWLPAQLQQALNYKAITLPSVTNVKLFYVAMWETCIVYISKSLTLNIQNICKA